jgi:hypothetical protein
LVSTTDDHDPYVELLLQWLAQPLREDPQAHATKRRDTELRAAADIERS